MSKKLEIPVIIPVTGVRTFVLERLEDESGVSGTGVVAQGVVMPSGRAVVEWLRPPHALNMYQSLEDVEAVHGHGGKTRVKFVG